MKIIYHNVNELEKLPPLKPDKIDWLSRFV